MPQTDQEKRRARIRNSRCTANLTTELTEFLKQLKSSDVECLDGDYKNELIDLRYLLLKGSMAINPVIDEGIKSISAQSVSGRLSQKEKAL